MQLDQILAAIRDKHPSPDIQFLVEKISAGDLSARKQLADRVCALPAKLSPSVILEISCWGVNDSSSQIPEIRALA